MTKPTKKTKTPPTYAWSRPAGIESLTGPKRLAAATRARNAAVEHVLAQAKTLFAGCKVERYEDTNCIGITRGEWAVGNILVEAANYAPFIFSVVIAIGDHSRYGHVGRENRIRVNLTAGKRVGLSQDLVDAALALDATRVAKAKEESERQARYSIASERLHDTVGRAKWKRTRYGEFNPPKRDGDHGLARIDVCDEKSARVGFASGGRGEGTRMPLGKVPAALRIIARAHADLAALGLKAPKASA